MRTLSIAVTLLLAAPGVTLAADAKKPPNLTADVVVTMRDGASHTGKMYFLDGKYRSEMTVNGQPVTSVLDTVAKKSWTLIPPPMGCIEQPFTTDPMNPLASAEPEKQELVGSETVDGHPTKKYRVTTTVNGKPYESFQWRATDLQNLPIQWSDAAGQTRSMLKNVKLGRPDPALFKTPANCRSMSEMMKGFTAPRQQ
jgi:hypothetical protein